MAQPTFTTWPDLIKWWQANPKATVGDCQRTCRVSREKAGKARDIAASLPPENPLEGHASAPEGNDTRAGVVLPFQTETPPVIEGVTPDDLRADAEHIFKLALQVQEHRERLDVKRARQTLAFPSEPVALCFLSDLHFGSPGVDYRAARADAELIGRTPGMWAAFVGDGPDNFILPKLAHAGRDAVTPPGGQWTLLEAWLEWLNGKLALAVSGNHDAWGLRASGVDQLARLLPKHVLYDPAEVFLTVRVGSAEWRGLIRHKTRMNSVYNALHGVKQQWRLGARDFDFGVAGHVHRGCVYEPFYGHGKRRWAISLGAYKVADPHASEEGFLGGGLGTAAALVLTPDGRSQAFDDLELASDFLTFLRGKRWAA